MFKGSDSIHQGLDGDANMLVQVWPPIGYHFKFRRLNDSLFIKAARCSSLPSFYPTLTIALYFRICKPSTYTRLHRFVAFCYTD